MSEPKPDPPRSLNTPQSPAESKPLDGPDQQALEIIERAAREMATRRPRIHAPASDDLSANTVPPEPVTERTKEPATELAQEFEQEFEQELAKNVVKPFEESAPPVETSSVEPLPVETLRAETLPMERWPVEDIKPPFAMHPAGEPAPPEDAKPLHPVEMFKPADDAKPPDVSEPVAQPMLIELLDFGAPMPSAAAIEPAEAIAPALPKAAPPVTPPARPRIAPATAAPAMRPMFDDHFHISLTAVQSAALAVAIFAFVLAAFGMAARGWVSAHDWSCRVGMTTNSCPPGPPPKSLGRAEIPA
jgi:hypothetical protein